MRSHFIWIFSILLAFALGSVTGAGASSSTQIVADETAGVIRVMVKGKEVATFDHAGLHVAGDVAFDGKLADTHSDAAPEKAP
jgi:hypothetical protein